jgi:hypothetical protein
MKLRNVTDGGARLSFLTDYIRSFLAYLMVLSKLRSSNEIISAYEGL